MDVIKNKTANKIVPYVKLIERKKLNAPISLHLLITDWCVNKCNMCDHWKTIDKKILSLDAIKRIWNEMNENGGESICLTGGDPVIHPDFNDILELERKFDLGIITTGNFKEDFKWELLKSLRWIRFSIDTLDSDRYKIIRGRNNLYSEIIPNLEKAKKLNREIGINFTIQKLNHDEVFDIIKFNAENAIYRLMLYPMHGNFDLAIGVDEILSIIEQLDLAMSNNFHKIIPENNIEFLYENLNQILKDNNDDVRSLMNLNKYPCMINKIHLSIGADGSVYPCEAIVDDTDKQGLRNMSVRFVESNGEYNKVPENNMHNIGNINAQSLIDIWRQYYDCSFSSEKCKICYSRYRPIVEAYHKNKGSRIFI